MQRLRDLELVPLSTLMSSAEVETAGLSFPKADYGSVRYVDVRAKADTKVGLQGTADLRFLNKFYDWVGPVEESPAITLRRAELELEDPDLPEDLRKRMMEAYDGYMKLEAEHAELFRALAVLAPNDRAFSYFD